MISVQNNPADPDVSGPEVGPLKILWCLHVRASDDVYPTRSYEQALQFADWITDRFDRFKQADDPNMPYLRAIPAIWPWDEASHAAGIEHTEAEWTVPVDDGATSRSLTDSPAIGSEQ